MTLIIGIKCDSGAVLAADSAATLGGITGGSTVRQETKKLKIIKDRIIIGTSGPVGLAQLLAGELEESYEDQKLSGLKPFRAMSEIAKKFNIHFKTQRAAAESAAQLLGPRVNETWNAPSIVALAIRKQVCLFEIPALEPAEEKNEEMPFVSIGSAQNTADPFLAFLRRITWKNKLPDLEKAVLSAVWTLRHAIQISPGGVAEPIQVAHLTKTNGGFEARELTQNDLSEHLVAIKELEDSIASEAMKLSTGAPEAPIPPT